MHGTVLKGFYQKYPSFSEISKMPFATFKAKSDSRNYMINFSLITINLTLFYSLTLSIPFSSSPFALYLFCIYAISNGFRSVLLQSSIREISVGYQPVRTNWVFISSTGTDPVRFV